MSLHCTLAKEDDDDTVLTFRALCRLKVPRSSGTAGTASNTSPSTTATTRPTTAPPTPNMHLRNWSVLLSVIGLVISHTPIQSSGVSSLTKEGQACCRCLRCVAVCMSVCLKSVASRLF